MDVVAFAVKCNYHSEMLEVKLLITTKCRVLNGRAHVGKHELKR